MLVICFLITSCTPAVKINSTSTPNLPLDANKGYPVPSPKLPKAYPEPVDTPEPMSTQDPVLGSAKGMLLLNSKPVQNCLLFLSDIAKDSQGKEVLVSVDYMTKNRTTTSNDGSFIFVNIPPKRYALVLVVIPNSYLLLRPGKQEAVTLTVESGKTVDLGRLDFDDLPIPK